MAKSQVQCPCIRAAIKRHTFAVRYGKTRGFAPTSPPKAGCERCGQTERIPIPLQELGLADRLTRGQFKQLFFRRMRAAQAKADASG